MEDVDLTRKQILFIEHFPCETCGADPYHVVRTIRFGAWSEEVNVCEPGLKLLQQMLEEQGIDMHFEPQN